MKPLDYAMQIELEGEKLYRSFAKKTSSNQLKTLFNWLANSEINHYKKFNDMQENEMSETEDITLLSDTYNILKKVIEKNSKPDFIHNQLNIYSDILEIEKQMALFYEQKAKKTNNIKLKTIYQNIADEEKRHQFLIENLIKLVINPEVWLKEDNFDEILSYIPL